MRLRVRAEGQRSRDWPCKLDATVAKALADVSVTAKYAELGAETVPLKTAAFKTKLQQESKLLGGLIEKQGIRAE